MANQSPARDRRPPQPRPSRTCRRALPAPASGTTATTTLRPSRASGERRSASGSRSGRPDEGYGRTCGSRSPTRRPLRSSRPRRRPVAGRTAGHDAVANDPLSGADESSHWMRRDTFPAEDWVFRVGPIVGLVLVTGVGSGVPETIAEHAVERAATAVAGATATRPCRRRHRPSDPSETRSHAR